MAEAASRRLVAAMAVASRRLVAAMAVASRRLVAAMAVASRRLVAAMAVASRRLVGEGLASVKEATRIIADAQATENVEIVMRRIPLEELEIASFADSFCFFW